MISKDVKDVTGLAKDVKGCQRYAGLAKDVTGLAKDVKDVIESAKDVKGCQKIGKEC